MNLEDALKPYLTLERFRELAGKDLRDVTRRPTLYRTEEQQDLEYLLAFVRTLFTPQERSQYRTPESIGQEYVIKLGHATQEEMHVVGVDTQKRVVSEHMVYRGTVDAMPIRIGELFKEALKCGAAGVFVVHNHPSGATYPSPETIMYTRQIVEAGNLLDCTVHDHIIVGTDTFTSLRELGVCRFYEE